MKRYALAIVGLLVAALGFTGAPALASSTDVLTVDTVAAIPGDHTSMSPDAGCTIVAYGYRGTYLCGTHPHTFDWDTGPGTRLETFIIATDRTIWHVWPGSGGWKVLPGNGHADDVLAPAAMNGIARFVQVVAQAADGSLTYWYTEDPGSGWNGWHSCGHTLCWS